MSDAANNALLFEEEIDIRVIDAFIKALEDNNPRIAEPMNFLLERMLSHPRVRQFITNEVRYQVERVISDYIASGVPTKTPDPHNPRMDMYRKKGFSAW